MSNYVEILDSTLRDGAQGEGISFSVQDKLHIVSALDELGVAYIEAGNPGSNPKDLEFFAQVKKIKLNNSQVCAFGATRRKDISCAEDMNLQSLLSAGTETVVIFGKTWDFQVTDILKASLEENLSMIEETCAYLREAGRTVIYDAEHFFDGYTANPSYAIKTLHAAVKGGASVLVLCDTKGASMLAGLEQGVKSVYEEFKNTKTAEGVPVKIGIHTHNDCGLAAANSLLAVASGACHVQGTLLGFGERTGNADLASIIANLELKMDKKCLPEGNLKNLTPLCRKVAEIANISLPSSAPYIGSSAFAHKAGMHIDAVTKNPFAYEHTNPENVGNERVFLMSEVAGRAMILEKIRKFEPSIQKDSPIVTEITRRVKELEHEGYQFEGADGSFELLVRKIIGKYKPFFKLHYYKTLGELPKIDDTMCAYAQLKIEVENQLEITAGEGDGPVHALDTALRKALERFYPEVMSIRLIDYKVRVLDSKSATAAKVRVLIESSDSTDSWITVGVSSDIMEASWLALVDSFEYKFIRDMEKRFKPFL
ncbi:citramalate synthase [Treponema sp. HNW]|uniref:citramalate synthase n=1 Tax=unclassified Treponema TaxID=2638727 RepID=UPI003D100EAF